MGVLSNKVAVVTGGGSGMGQAIALEFEKEGATVVIVGRTESKLQDTLSKSKGTIMYHVGDVGDKDFVSGLFKTLKSKDLIPSIITNCAGVINVKAADGTLDNNIVMNINNETIF